MVGDITYIPTWQGWEYLATVIDCATRKVIGWAMGDNYKTPLITAAIEMAARNIEIPTDAVFHSDYAEDGVKPRNRGLACSGGLADGFFGLTFGAIGDCRGPGACLR
jgi:transposase InsO family protein